MQCSCGVVELFQTDHKLWVPMIKDEEESPSEATEPALSRFSSYLLLQASVFSTRIGSVAPAAVEFQVL